MHHFDCKFLRQPDLLHPRYDFQRLLHSSSFFLRDKSVTKYSLPLHQLHTLFANISLSAQVAKVLCSPRSLPSPCALFSAGITRIWNTTLRQAICEESKICVLDKFVFFSYVKLTRFNISRSLNRTLNFSSSILNINTDSYFYIIILKNLFFSYKIFLVFHRSFDHPWNNQNGNNAAKNWFKQKKKGNKEMKWWLMRKRVQSRLTT